MNRRQPPGVRLGRTVLLAALVPCISAPASLLAPTITSLSPNARTAGGPTFILTVNGTGFVNDMLEAEEGGFGSRVIFGSTQLPTSFISSTQLQAVVPAPLIAQPGVVNVLVTNLDSGQNSNSLPFTINPPPSITTVSLPGGTIQVPYSHSLSGTGGTTPYTWSIQSGSLPPGLSMSSDGVISGTPTVAGTTSFTVRLLDAGQVSATRLLSLTIQSSAPVINALSPPATTAGAAQFLLTVDGANFAPDGPAGLSIASTGARVFFNNNLLATTFVNSTRLTAVVPAALVAAQGEAMVRVSNVSLQQDSNNFPFPIHPPPNITTASLPAGQIGVPYAQTLAGAGGTPPYAWTLAAGSLPGGLNLSGSGVISGTPAAVGTFPFTVRLTDSAGVAATRAFSLTIDPPPLRITSASPLPPGTVTTPYTFLFGASGGQPGYVWSVVSGSSLPPGLGLSNEGVLSGTPTAPGVFPFNIQVTDSAQRSATGAFTLTINAGALEIVTSVLPEVEVLAPYFVTLAGNGGLPPYTWLLSGGALPPGVALGTDGVIRGTPTARGSFLFTVMLRDSAGKTVNRSFFIDVTAPPMRITSATPLPEGAATAPYGFLFSAADGAPPYRWSVPPGSSLPPGLTLSPEGRLSGTPTVAGNFQFDIVATDTVQASDRKTFTLAIRTAPLVITTTSPLPPGVQGTRYNQVLDARGGVPPYSWSLIGSGLPPGLVLNTAGVLSGTPTTAGSFQFTVRVNDAAGGFTDKTFTVEIDPPALTITSASPLPPARVGSDYSFPFAAVGGTPPYTWSVAGGSLPAGLTLNTSGVLSGAPASSGDFQFTVQVRDSAQGTSSKSFELNVQPAALGITTASPLAAGSSGQQYSLAFQASGGTPPYSWSIGGGTLPDGLAFSATGVLSGMAGLPGDYEFTVVVKDNANRSASKAFAVSVRALPLRITTIWPLPPGTPGAPYGTAFAATGGVPPYRWEMRSGPGGLTLSAGGELSGSITEAGPLQISVQVTDRVGTTASGTFTLPLSLPAPPPVSVAGLPAVADGAQQPSFTIQLGAPYPLPLTGRAVLSFVPDAVVPADDPAVQFSTGGRTLEFSIPAGQTNAVFPAPRVALQTGTVAGVITIAFHLFAGDQDVTGAPAPVQRIQVRRQAPTITSVRIVRTAAGFEVQVTGFSTPRQINRATFRFTAAAGGSLQTTEVSPEVAAAFTQWFQSAASRNFGGAFLYTQPFTVQGSINDLGSVTVTLTNAEGTSGPASANF